MMSPLIIRLTAYRPNSFRELAVLFQYNGLLMGVGVTFGIFTGLIITLDCRGSLGVDVSPIVSTEPFQP